MGGEHVVTGGPGLGAAIHEVRRDGAVERGVPLPGGVEDVAGQSAVAGGRLDEVDARRPIRPVAHAPPPRGEALGKQGAEHGADIDAGKEIARAARPSGRTGVVADLGRVEREVHELGHRDGAPLTDAFGDERAAAGAHYGHRRPLTPS